MYFNGTVSMYNGFRCIFDIYMIMDFNGTVSMYNGFRCIFDNIYDNGL